MRYVYFPYAKIYKWSINNFQNSGCCCYFPKSGIICLLSLSFTVKMDLILMNRVLNHVNSKPYGISWPIERDSLHFFWRLLIDVDRFPNIHNFWNPIRRDRHCIMNIYTIKVIHRQMDWSFTIQCSICCKNVFADFVLKIEMNKNTARAVFYMQLIIKMVILLDKIVLMSQDIIFNRQQILFLENVIWFYVIIFHA